MKKTVILSALISITLAGLAGCSIAPPVIQITGDKTVIERQIVGEYQELEKDAWIISSVKTSVQRSRGTGAVAGGDMELFRAMKIREYHRDKLRRYKDEAALGETFEGYVQYRPVAKYEKNREDRDILMKVIQNENIARKTIFTRSLVMILKKDPAGEEVAKFGRLFAGEQREIAQKNDWIQKKPGRWVKK